MKVLRFMLFMILVALVSYSQAQQGPGPGGRRPNREKMRERLNTIKIWKMTEAVGLTTEQSEKFFPIYNQQRKDHEKLEKERFELVDKLSNLADEHDGSDSEINKTIDKLIDHDGKFAQLRKKYLKEIAAVISVKQQARLLVFEERFRRRLQEDIRDIRRGTGKRRRDIPR